MRLLWVVVICQVFFSTALRGTIPIVSLYADILGASPQIIGLLISSFAILPMLFAIRAGKWVDHYGTKKMVLIGGIGMFISLILPVLFPILPVLFLNQLIIGISQVCVVVSLQKTVGGLPGDPDRLIAIYTLAGAFGEFLGPLITGFLFDEMGVRWTFSAMALAVVLGLIVCTKLTKGISTNKKISAGKQKQPANQTWRMLGQGNLRKALIISGLVLYSKDIFIAYFPVYGNGVGISPSQIGIIISLLSATAMVVRLMQFRLVHQFGRGQIIMTTLIISGIAYLLLPTTGLFSVLILLSIMLGAGLGLGQPLSLVYTMNVSPSERKGEVLGLRLTFNRASQFIAPFIFGAIGTVGGLSTLFVVQP